MTTVLRTPDDRFDDLDDWPYEPVYTDVEVDGTTLRLARVDVGPLDGDTVVLLHGEPTWGYLWRDVIPPLADAGHRVVVPDLVGLGRSDKPQGRDWYDYHRMADALDQHLEAAVGDAPITLVVHDWGGLLGLPWATQHPERVRRLVIMDTFLYEGTPRVTDAWQRFHDFVARSDSLPIAMLVDGAVVRDLNDAERRAFEAPFPEESFQGCALALPTMVIRSDDQAGADAHVAAWAALGEWDHAPVLVLWGGHDAVIPPVVGERFAEHIPAAMEPEVLEGGHFLQLDVGTAIGERIVELVTNTPVA